MGVDIYYYLHSFESAIVKIVILESAIWQGSSGGMESAAPAVLPCKIYSSTNQKQNKVQKSWTSTYLWRYIQTFGSEKSDGGSFGQQFLEASSGSSIVLVEEIEVKK